MPSGNGAIEYIDYSEPNKKSVTLDVPSNAKYLLINIDKATGITIGPSSKFKLSADGTLIATKATLSGSLNGVSGTFKNLTATGTLTMKGNAINFDGITMKAYSSGISISGNLQMNSNIIFSAKLQDVKSIALPSDHTSFGGKLITTAFIDGKTVLCV
jgi:hypothetical protein